MMHASISSLPIAGRVRLRTGVLGLLALVLVCLSAAHSVAAQADSTARFQDVAAASGAYHFQVPWDWTQKAPDMAPDQDNDGSLVTMDTIMVSPDNSAFVWTLTANGGPSDQYLPAHLSDQTEDMLSQLGSGLQDGGASAMTETGSPSQVTVANAAAALEAGLSYVEPDGRHVITARVALQDTNIYVLILGTQGDVAITDPAFASILDSFALARSTPTAAFQTVAVSGSAYQFQVPQSWQQQPPDMAPIHESDGSVTNVDTILVSPDNAVSVRTETASGGPKGQYVAANLPTEASAFQRLLRSLLQQNGASGIVDLGSPRSVTVTNAEAAMEDALAYTAVDGQHIVTARLAVQDQSMYFLVLNAPADFSSNDPAATAILNSFALASSAAPSALQTVADSSGAFQVQVPQDWQPQPLDAGKAQDSGGPTMSIKEDLDAPDGITNAKVVTVSGGAANLYASAALSDFVQALLSGAQSDLQDNGASAFINLGTPHAVMVANADAALEGGFICTGPNGPRIVTVRAALQGQRISVLELYTPADFARNDPAFATIMNSFALAPVVAR